jgi:hypothetical protein
MREEVVNACAVVRFFCGREAWQVAQVACLVRAVPIFLIFSPFPHWSSFRIFA